MIQQELTHLVGKKLPVDLVFRNMLYMTKYVLHTICSYVQQGVVCLAVAA